MSSGLNLCDHQIGYKPKKGLITVGISSLDEALSEREVNNPLKLKASTHCLHLVRKNVLASSKIAPNRL